jgi:hypothetical protein
MATGSDWMSRYPVGEVCACTTGNCTISTPSGAFSPEMTTSSDTRSDRRSRDPEEGWKGVRMRNQKLHNIHPSGDFSSEMTSSTGGLPLDFSYISPCGCSLGRPRLSFSSPFTGYLPLSQPFFMGSPFNIYISNKSLLFSDMLCSTPSSLSQTYSHAHVSRDIHPW